MKFIALFTISFCSFAFASDDFALLKTSGGGMVVQEFARTQTCKLYKSDSSSEYKMLIEEQYGPVKTKEFVKLTITGLEGLISNSEKEVVVKKPNYLCDAPESTYFAINTRGERVELFQSGGCGSPRINRAGPYSAHLRSILDRYCPMTHDYGN